MVQNQEADRVPLLLRRLHALHRGQRPIERHLRVVAGKRSLAHVMVEQRENQDGGFVDFRQEASESPQGRILVGTQLLQPFEAHQRVLVHRVAVVKVADHQADHALPFREQHLHEPRILQHAHRPGRVRQR